jgi:chromosome segregation ATPase
MPQLDYFIVDTCAQAKAIADYLRTKKIGRMTFLIKELINQSNKDITLVTCAPSQTKLIIDLIKCSDGEVRNILVWALGNTLVTSELDIAMKVAYYDERKFRVITTKGEFIDSSGTITKLSLKSIGGEDQLLITKKLETLKRLRQTLDSKIN